MEEHSMNRFLLAIVGIVAVVGIVGLIVMFTGYNLPSQTQVGQAALREYSITTTTLDTDQLFKDIKSSTERINGRIKNLATNIKVLAEKETDPQIKNVLSSAYASLSEASSTNLLSASDYLAEQDSTKASVELSTAFARIDNANKLLGRIGKNEYQVSFPPGLLIAIRNIPTQKTTPDRRKRNNALTTLNDLVAKWDKELSEQETTGRTVKLCDGLYKIEWATPYVVNSTECSSGYPEACSEAADQWVTHKCEDLCNTMAKSDEPPAEDPWGRGFEPCVLGEVSGVTVDAFDPKKHCKNLNGLFSVKCTGKAYCKCDP